jgi:predicted nucleic acid-binding protein
LSHLRALEKLSDDGEIVVFTPTITLIEVLACHLTAEQEQIFQAFLKRSTVEVVSVSRKIADTAREIRSHYRANGMQIAVPDSIHLATAIHYRATALHTYDGCGTRPKATDLLRLSTPIIGLYELNICKPEPPPVEAEATPVPRFETANLFGSSDNGELSVAGEEG